MERKRIALWKIAVFAAVAAVFIARFDFSVLDFSDDTRAQRESISKLNDVLKLVNNYYVDSLNWNDVSTGAIEGLLQKLDPHSVYIDPETVKHNDENFSGHYYGIGIQFDILEGYINVIAVIPGSPSEKAGLLAGDKIIKIDGSSAHNISMSEVPKKLKGPKDTPVTVTVKRGEAQPFDVEIIRGEIPIVTINTYFKANAQTGYVWLNRFASTTAEELEKALDDLEGQGMRQLILDLRGNGGGFLSQAVQVVARFVKGHRKVVFTKGKLSRFDETYYTDDFGMTRARIYPLIVLIDHSSASASEIVAGALQDYDRALIVGETSFGKGLVQNEFELDDGSRLRLTVSKYYTPSGRLIQRPYKGKNIEDYYMESYADSSESSKDTVRTRPQFKTRNGRIVYGGGGITPDVKIPYQSPAKNTRLATQFLQKRIFYETAASFVIAHPGWGKSFEYFHKHFRVDYKLLKRLKKQAEEAGINVNDKDFKADEIYLKNRLKAEIARNIWGNFYYYRIGMDVDNQYLKALTLFPKWQEWLGDVNQK